MTLALVMLGGAAGAVLRHLVDRLLPGSHRIPVATLAVNVAGSFALGMLSAAGDALPRALLLLLGVGFCGALTTWSTFAFQSLDLESRWWAAANVAATLVLGIGAATLGRAVAL
jgi:CrcB protein